MNKKTKGADARKNKRSHVNVRRLSFPNDEKNQPWLSMLLDAYYVVEKGVASAIESEQKKGRKLACRRGCSNCCKTHKDIPVYPLELAGISWYVTEKIAGAEREKLRESLVNHRENDPCPFLVEKACAIHPMRPMACRQFNVFGRPCSEGEDPFYTRIKDVMAPVKKHMDQAFFIMLPFYGVEKESDRVRAVENGSMHRVVTVLQSCNWKSLAEKMDEYDIKQKNK